MPKIYKYLLITIVSIVAYSNTFNAPFAYDDLSSIVGNTYLDDPGNYISKFSFTRQRSLTDLTFALNRLLHQDWLPGYHLTNLLIHIVTAILVMKLVTTTLDTPLLKKTPMAKQKNLLGFLCGLVFATHPIQTQSVTYIVQRYASLATLFYVLSIYLFSLAFQSKKSTTSKILLLAGALTAAILAIYSKETAFTIPLMMTAYYTYFFGLKKKLPAMIWLSSLSSIIILIAINLFSITAIFRWQAISESGITITGSNYSITQLLVLLKYLQLLLIPIGQNLIYDFPILNSLWDLRALAGLVTLTTLIGIAVKIYSKWRLVSFGIIWFLISLLVESSFIPLKHVIFEHRLYLPMVGFSIVLVSTLWHVLQKKNPAFIYTILILVISYSLLTINRNRVWQTSLSLWQDVVNKSPRLATTNTNLGTAWAKNANFAQATFYLKRAISLDPGYKVAYNNLGNVLASQGYQQQSIDYFKKAIDLDPTFENPYNNLGYVYLELNQPDLAIAYFQQALKLNANFAKAQNNLDLAQKIKSGDLPPLQ